MSCTKARDIDLAEFAVDSRAPAWAEFREHYPQCAECSRAVADWSALKHALRAEAQLRSETAHLSEAQLAALASQPLHLASDDLARLEAHLAACAPCRTELAVVRGFDFTRVAGAPERADARDRFVFAAAWRRPAFAAAAAVAMIAIAAAVLWRAPRESAPLPVPPVAKVEPSVEPGAPPAAVDEPLTAEQPAPAPTEPAPAPPAAPEVPRPAVVAKQPEPAPLREPAAPVEIAALLPTEPPVYAPGSLAGGPSVRVGEPARSAGAEVLPPVALAPAQIGQSAGASPNLYWFLPAATPLAVEVTITDGNAAEPLLEVMLAGPHAAGIHRVSLAERGIRLRPGVDYQWFVALVRDPARRSLDAVSAAAIRYAPPTGEVTAQLAAAPPGTAAHAYAAAGFWYDSFDQLSRWIAAERDTARLHQHRAALLDQVGLEDVAAFDRH